MRTVKTTEVLQLALEFVKRRSCEESAITLQILHKSPILDNFFLNKYPFLPILYQSKFSKFWFKIPVFWQNTYITPIFMGDICKCIQHFWTHPFTNSSLLLAYLYVTQQQLLLVWFPIWNQLLCNSVGMHNTFPEGRHHKV